MYVYGSAETKSPLGKVDISLCLAIYFSASYHIAFGGETDHGSVLCASSNGAVRDMALLAIVLEQGVGGRGACSST